ncbi:Transcriptional regulators, LysR family [Rubrivivax sp. A210]|uniref:LysR family transcriptional regulator n=1 Tax=Rubrivivax sp. A210 TaxID=2772301 RepID=UPI0019CDB6D9|nr:LysR family transcriptional regulator [Rubrivivax sp. A210]CAD5372719.1 Transcriptional regulators, LysR family [Rubrivivax sp. A210]
MNPARVDFVTLRLFCAVAQSGSITKGASRCHLALSAASRRLADFEAAVGSALLERTAQGVRLTAAGHVALHHAMRLSQGFDLFGGELAEYAQGYRGHVRLWANMSALTESLPEALARFMARQPEIKVEVEEQLSGDIARAVVEGLADIGVFAEGTPADGLLLRPFQTDELVLICARGHELAGFDALRFRDALVHPFVGLDRGSSLLTLVTEAAQAAGLPLRLRVQVTSFGAMCRMVGAGLGLGVLPRAACAPLLQAYGLTALRLDEAWARRRLLAACSAERPLSAAAQLLWDSMAADAAP